MEARIWFGIFVLLGLAAAFLGPAAPAGIGALVVAIGLIALGRGEKDHWFLVLAAGALVAVAAGFTSPIWSTVLVLVLLGWVEDRFAFFSSREGKVAFLVFAAAVAVVLLAPALLMRHIFLLFGGLGILLLVSGLFLSLSWYRLVWSARRSEE
ncbi:hypothetical protein E2N92_09075 [Methanofollis formosanus]|uniref:Uncharacterized protein n=1 Tax=Methanofollis formosanus TaxID=299308 RepID=A0A8G1A2W5_9EURY|nr:hypothetical protein [Methanofollis formosanus]QYZ79570.1 hypothetical protein E2N92_09075 [Methanofollis formosanus]